MLFALLLFFGEEINGARLWIKLGPIEYEPIELIKLFIVLFLAAYLAETADVIGNARPWSLRANVKYLGPLFIGWGVSMAILVRAARPRHGDAAARDLCNDPVRRDAPRGHRRCSGRCSSSSAPFGPCITIRTCTRASRCGATRSPTRSGPDTSRRRRTTRSPRAACSAAGTGSAIPEFIPDVATDYVYAAFAEEFGVIGAVIVLVIFLDLVRRIFATGLQQPDLYTKLLATGLAATLGFQVVIIVSGVIGLLPLTGITLPFMSYGGSSLVANFLLVALVWAMSARPRSAE